MNFDLKSQNFYIFLSILCTFLHQLIINFNKKIEVQFLKNYHILKNISILFIYYRFYILYRLYINVLHKNIYKYIYKYLKIVW